MKRILLIIAAALMLFPLGLSAQTYDALWKQVEEARNRDLPKTAMAVLQQVEDKALKEHAYGQLLKSALMHARLQSELAPDSLLPSVKRLERQADATQDVALKAVYDAVLSKIYCSNSQLGDDWATKRDDYRQRALAHPDALARVQADTYHPFVVKGKDSQLYGDDLLSVIGTELEAWQWMTAYYQRVGNRPAACLSAVHTAATLKAADSLLAVYGDLPEAAELAIRRYDLMLGDPFTAAEKYHWLQQALQRWGGWRRADVFRNQLQTLTNTNFQLSVGQQVGEVGKAQTVRLTELRNIRQLTMRVYRTNLQGDTRLYPHDEADYQKMKPGLTELKEQTRTLTFGAHADYDIFEDSTLLAGLPSGVYMLEVTSQPDTKVQRMLYFVSGLRVMLQHQPDKTVRYVVVDATTGQPVAGARLLLTFSSSRNQPAETKMLICDHRGEAVYRSTDQRVSTFRAFTSDDTACPEYNAYGNYYYYERQYGAERTSVFTDRAIYRPGQTVYATAIVWKKHDVLNNRAVTDRAVTFELRDANYKLIGEQQATTDRFGKCAVTFTLPTGLLNGHFTIRANNDSRSFRVEEYRRPSFQVEFADYDKPYQRGDVIRTQGKATTYAGVPVQGGKVRYAVRRRMAYWWMNYSWYWQRGSMGRSLQDEVLSEGETVTADDGTFSVEVPMLLPKDPGSGPMFYHFVVEADVTDVAGETHSGTLSLPLGSQATVLTCDLPKQVRKDQLPKVTFSRRNAAGKEIEGTVKYRLDNGKWRQAPANCQFSVLSSPLKSGEHRLQAICETDTIDLSFVVFGLDDKKAAVPTSDWFYVSHEQFPSDGSPVTVQVGSSDPHLHIVYGLYAGDKLIESGAVEKDGELLNRQLRYREEYGNGLLVTYAWVKNGECYRHQAFIRRPMPDKQLRLSWVTFRDRLIPGQQEEWRLSVKKPDGTPADASLMAVLYDKSLDALVRHQWSFTPQSSLSQPSASWQYRTMGSLEISGTGNREIHYVPALDYSHFDQEVYPYYFSPRRLMVRGMAMASNRAPTQQLMMAKAVTADAAMEESAASGEALESAADTADEPVEEVSVRENLNETAFCYPSLITDKEGGVTLRFTLPESLTTWRLMGVANTTDMMYGAIEGEAIAKKDVMIQPNLPRFVRQGDQAQISARIINTSDHRVNGQAKLQLLVPETEEVVTEQTVPFAVEAGKTGSVNYQLSIDGINHSLLVCKVTASGDGFSDGEQHYLPILPDKEYVVKTVPYTLNGQGVQTIDLTKLFPHGTTQQKLTMEYTHNPVWLMVQSLPTLGQPSEHSAIDQAASYYSNLLAKTLLKQNPQVKSTFEQWKREAATIPSLTTLHSSLHKNQELKALLLAETPWVADADREQEQKQRLGDFFDENMINLRLQTAVEKLKELQHADGSFSWFKGMEGCVSMTVAVEEMLVRLDKMAGLQGDTRQLQKKAFDYLGKEMTDLVARLQKEEKRGVKPTFPSFTALRWLYLCALDGRQLTGSVKSANDYLTALLKKEIKRQTIYEKALTAVVLAAHGDTTLANDYVQSLKEYTVYTEEMGRYYDTPRAAYSWYDYRIPTEVAAIEAIQEVTPEDEQTIDEMRRWLLQEKRTQVWDTPINSVNAIYAFLKGNGLQLMPKDQTPAVFAMDGTAIQLPAATAGLGYVKTAIEEPKGQTFTVTKSDDGTSWGAVYAQYLQKTADVTASESGISIKREIIPLSPSASLTALQVGERVKVRLVIETSRDLDFVQVVDRRAACMEPLRQLSGYQNGAYVSPKDMAMHYFYRKMTKGKHIIETIYYIDRAGRYETGTCTSGCAYAPEYRATAPSQTIHVKQQ